MGKKLKRGPGRPEGPPTEVLYASLDPELVAKVRALAGRWGMSLSAATDRLLRAGISRADASELQQEIGERLRRKFVVIRDEIDRIISEEKSD